MVQSIHVCIEVGSAQMHRSSRSLTIPATFPLFRLYYLISFQHILTENLEMKSWVTHPTSETTVSILFHLNK